MTPLEIEILMHYGCRADDYRDGDHSAPAVKAAIEAFLDGELLRHEGFKVERFDDGKLRARYAVTPRARAYIEALCRVPLPMTPSACAPPLVNHITKPPRIPWHEWRTQDGEVWVGELTPPCAPRMKDENQGVRKAA